MEILDGGAIEEEEETEQDEEEETEENEDQVVEEVEVEEEEEEDEEEETEENEEELEEVEVEEEVEEEEEEEEEEELLGCLSRYQFLRKDSRVFGLLRYYSVCICNYLRTFRFKLSVPSLKVKDCLALEDGTDRLRRNAGN